MVTARGVLVVESVKGPETQGPRMLRMYHLDMPDFHGEGPSRREAAADLLKQLQTRAHGGVNPRDREVIEMIIVQVHECLHDQPEPAPEELAAEEWWGTLADLE